MTDYINWSAFLLIDNTLIKVEMLADYMSEQRDKLLIDESKSEVIGSFIKTCIRCTCNAVIYIPYYFVVYVVFLI